MDCAPAGPVRAAQYVRMSTEHQQYSTENQADALRHYADRDGYEIVVRTYADEGRSGLRLEGRDALQQLIADVESGAADFSKILVYDVAAGAGSRTPTRVPTTNTDAAAPGHSLNLVYMSSNLDLWNQMTPSSPLPPSRSPRASPCSGC